MIHSILLALLGDNLVSSVPDKFQGRYVAAVGTCKSAPELHVRENSVDWLGRTDRVILIEDLSASSAHFIITDPKASRGVVELHFELQGEDARHLVVIDHLDEASFRARNQLVMDAGIIGFFQRCASNR
ncbi:hypothetical protein [Sphingomonas japonica]|uniref:Uncharacterized protein n=1 Tax=Sphingomonas japonica TaxID=511662 RepID=A0ABX0U8P3_9SPHN|nr:hypothetical protein [Sphingomonas japonica]NIJ25172.1 hypothetical protein [Sphingomonas japonica]